MMFASAPKIDALVTPPIPFSTTGRELRETLEDRGSFQVEVTGSGRPMILIPGLSSRGELWDRAVARYRSTHQCHVLTLSGFAGRPRIDGPLLESARQELAAYIREKGLDRPLIVGHSLGGFLALWLASVEPDLPGALIVVDAYPYLPAISQPEASPNRLRSAATAIRRMIENQTRNEYEDAVSSGSSLRPLVNREEDLDLLIEWGLCSDQSAVAGAMYEMSVTDLRRAIADIEAPLLVLGAWKGYRQYKSRDRKLAVMRSQYNRVMHARFAVSDSARHYIPLDEPEWMCRHIDAFVADCDRVTRQYAMIA